VLPFAILSLALAILIWMACYGILFVTRAMGGFIFDDFKMMIISCLGVFTCLILIAWGIWFIANRWPSTS
jgi:cation transporter-like permease